MEPKSLSATAMHVFELCPARYKAEMLDKTRNFGGGTAATTGSTVHGALEMFVKQCFIDQTMEPTLELIQQFFHLSYVQHFNSHDTETAEYLDGLTMISTWWTKRVRGENYFNEVKRIISCEVKESFDVQTSIGPIPFNYIWDRFDEVKPGVFKVVDYKSNRWDIRPDDLQKKIQPRAYALAAAIKLKSEGIEYDRIWVEFDMLRHDLRARVFTHEDNLATWNYLHTRAEEIIAMPADEAEERLNGECRFCVRKAGCDALKKNISVGGMYSIDRIEELIDIRAQMDFQKAGLTQLMAEIDTMLLTHAKELDIEKFDTPDNELVIGVSRRRSVDPEMVEKAIGTDLFTKYGSHSITMENVDKLLKGKELTPDQKSDLKSLIYDKIGNPSIKIKPKNLIDED